MNLIGITINHKTAPIELREAIHLNVDETVELISKLKDKVLSEGFIFSTCNRTEIYGIPYQEEPDTKIILDALLETKPDSQLKYEHYKQYLSCGAVKHLCEVSSGIDSLILGDSQILSQVKSAFLLSEDLKFTKTLSRRLAETVVRVGKRSIRETLIGEGAVTVSYAAVQVIEKIFANLEKKSALVIGAGETSELAAVHLKDKGVGSITVTNRTHEKAENLAAKINGSTLPFDSYKEHLADFDIIISATSSNDILITKKEISKAMNKRRGNPLCLMDIALPRDIDPKSKKLDNVFYHDIDSLNIIVDKNLEQRKNEIPKIRKIINEEMVHFFNWYNTLDIVPAIKSFRSFFEELRDDELTKIKNKLSDDDYQKVEAMTKRLVGRLLHNPTTQLRELAESGTHNIEASEQSIFLKELFNLNGTHKPTEE